MNNTWMVIYGGKSHKLGPHMFEKVLNKLKKICSTHKTVMFLTQSVSMTLDAKIIANTK
jgi:hypothetical protein